MDTANGRDGGGSRIKHVRYPACCARNCNPGLSLQGSQEKCVLSAMPTVEMPSFQHLTAVTAVQAAYAFRPCRTAGVIDRIRNTFAQ